MIITYCAPRLPTKLHSMNQDGTARITAEIDGKPVPIIMGLDRITDPSDGTRLMFKQHLDVEANCHAAWLNTVQNKFAVQRDHRINGE
jgi:hypothetical protein